MCTDALWNVRGRADGGMLAMFLPAIAVLGVRRVVMPVILSPDAAARPEAGT
jgi:hypothetical protein